MNTFKDEFRALVGLWKAQRKKSKKMGSRPPSGRKEGRKGDVTFKRNEMLRLFATESPFVLAGKYEGQKKGCEEWFHVVFNSKTKAIALKSHGEHTLPPSYILRRQSNVAQALEWDSPRW